MRHFPLEYIKKNDVLFYPDQPKIIVGDFLEIGPGNGHFLLSLAQSYPERQIVALELEKIRYRKISRRLSRLEISNVQLICGNALVVVPRYLSGIRFERIYVLFPDPWPKRRHAHNRLMTTEFLTALAKLLTPGGFLYISTDVRSYAETVAKNLTEIGSLNLLGDPFSSAEAIVDYRPTFFESVAVRDGALIHYLVAQRANVPGTHGE